MNTLLYIRARESKGGNKELRAGQTGKKKTWNRLQEDYFLRKRRSRAVTKTVINGLR